MVGKSAYCLVSISPVRAGASDESEIVTQLLFGEPIEVEEINAPWAKITTLSDGYSGYIDHKHLKFLSDKEARRWSEGISYLKDRERVVKTPWGNQRICRGSYLPENQDSFQIGSDAFTFETKSENTCQSIQDYASDYLNTPYLWGGKSPFGIDCSGITQIIYRLFGWNLPRDAWEQVDHGREIAFEDAQADDLAYFKNGKGKVTHVGILDGQGGIFHAAGHVRKDKFTIQGIIHSETGILSHTLYIIKRM